VYCWRGLYDCGASSKERSFSAAVDWVDCGQRLSCTQVLYHPARNLSLPHDDRISAKAVQMLNFCLGMGTRDDLNLRIGRCDPAELKALLIKVLGAGRDVR